MAGKGSAPGERRGGRQKGTPDKATAAKRAEADAILKIALDRLGPEAIEALGQSPAHMMRFLYIEAAKGGLGTLAASIAKDAAPYFDKRLAPTDTGDGDENRTTIIIKGGLRNRNADNS